MNRSVLSACFAAAMATSPAPLLDPTAHGVAGPLQHVALGDSCASGLGAGVHDPAGGQCKRSQRAYPALQAARYDEVSFAFAACAGAETTDVRTEQLGALEDGTDLVTLSVGGNDAGFAPVVIEAVERALASGGQSSPAS